jgi:hypothetical protein
MRRLPRERSAYSGFSLESLQYALLTPNQVVTDTPIPLGQGLFHGMSWGIDENALYVGTLALLLMVAGLATKGRREIPLVVTLVLLVWLSLGDRAAPISGWAALHHLPVFSAMRVAQRFRFVWMLILALFVGMGFQSIREYLTKNAHSRTLARIAIFAIFATVCVNLLENADAYATGLSVPAPPLRAADTFHQILRLPLYGQSGWATPGEGPQPLTAWSAMYPAIMENVGTTKAYEPVADGFRSSVVAAESTGYRGEVFVVGGNGTVQMVQWSPNRLVANVDAADNVSVAFNQNFFPGWHASAGSVFGANGLLAVSVAPGRQRVTLW